MTFPDWLRELNAIAQEHYTYPAPVVEDVEAEAAAAWSPWRDLYEDGYTPGAALVEDAARP